MKTLSKGRSTSEIQHEEWLKLALESAQMCAYRWDLKTNIIARSPRSSAGAIVDRESDSWLYSENLLQNVFSEDRPWLEEQIKIAIKAKREFNVEYRLSINESLRWFQAKGRPFYNSEGVATEIFFVTQDITQRKQNELDLKRKTLELESAKAKLKIALDSAGMAALTGNAPEVGFHSAEICRLFGIEDENACITRNLLLERLHPEDREAIVKKMNEVTKPQTNVEKEHRVILPNGDIRWLLVKGTHLPDEDSQCARPYLIFQDITQRKKNEEELKVKSQKLLRANEKLSRFSSVVAHDLKGPLNSIFMAADQLIDSADEKETKELSHFIKAGAGRMSDLINNLLVFATSSQQTVIPKESVPLENILNVVKANLKSAIHAAKAEIDVRGHLPELLAYPSQLLQLLQNLFSNALKFRSNRPPRLIFQSQDNEDFWCFSLQDNGTGMILDNHSKIFEPFQRFHESNIEGTGLGLSICKKIVELHGGKIWAESSLGLGSTFFFTLPK